MSAAGYDISAWTDFAVGVTGAAAALTGLLFVAVSINLQQILTFPGLPARAAQTLVLFFTPLLVCVLLLVPGPSGRVLGVELLVLGGLVGALLARLIQLTSRADHVSMGSLVLDRIAPSAVAVLGVVAAGISLTVDAGGGLMWIVPAVLAALVGGLANAWVLLIEIQR
jgi:modulator of FtsH protease